jgi:hypothetical protein
MRNCARRRVVKESSDSGIELEQSAESVATVNGSGLRRYTLRRIEGKVVFALAVPFKMVIIDVFIQRPSQ